MAGKKEMQKTVSFRMNLSKDDEREMYETITNHNRRNEDDPYGSSGAYIKAALKNYHDNEQKIQQQEHYKLEMQSYIRHQGEVQTGMFLKALGEHDRNLVAMVVEAVTGAMKGRDVFLPEEVKPNTTNPLTDNIKTVHGDIRKTTVISNNSINPVETEEEPEPLPEEAFSYLNGM